MLKDLRKKSDAELRIALGEKQKELAGVRMRIRMRQAPDTTVGRNLRREIAQILTVIGEKEFL